MRPKNLDLKKYQTDKTDYLKYYDPVFEPFVDKEIVLLELGIFKGGSLNMWHDYFAKGRIVGVDINLPENFGQSERIEVFQGSQEDEGFLAEVTSKTAPDGYDIIIDDASHLGELTKRSFWYLFSNALKPGGIYAIEDWGTSYWDFWPDGISLDLDSYLPQDNYEISKKPFPCHNYGMVGFIKQLIDEQAASDITKYQIPRTSKFEKMIINPCVVFIVKSK